MPTKAKSTDHHFVKTEDELLNLEEDTSSQIGVKALGLMKIPKLWRPPFLSVNSNLYTSWEKLDQDNALLLVDEISTAVFESTNSWDNSWNAGLIIRSSATNESLLDRGAYESRKLVADFSAHKISKIITEIFQQFSDKSNGGKLALIVQPYIAPKAEGHFSNERRVSKTVNQWTWEQTFPSSVSKSQINTQRDTANSENDQIFCSRNNSIVSRLRSVGRWCKQLDQGPTHIEWLWCGKNIWIVQLDFEDQSSDPGVDPKNLMRNIDHRRSSSPSQNSPWVEAKHTSKTGWKKLDNVQLFVGKGDVQYPPLYYITGDRYLNALSNNYNILEEINHITHGRAVCRTDCVSTGISKVNLPRTNTVSPEDIIAHIDETLANLQGKGAKPDEICFIMHKFIPALSAAWAKAEPSSQVVKIDSLWGVPDGLQYLHHDSTEYNIQLDQILSERLRYKPKFIQETQNGNWEEMAIQRKLARGRSLNAADVKDIAYRTQSYANDLNESVLVMWFCSIPNEVGIGRNVPWFRMPPHRSHGSKNRLGPEYQKIQISGLEDLTVAEESTNQKVILALTPNTELIRDDDKFLDCVIKLAKSRNWPVEIQGSILAHAFYKLESEGITTVAADPPKYTRVRGKRVFQKLVRDEIPNKITTGGEEPITARITKSEARPALLAKLFEEARELYDAESPEDVKLELADLLEVVRSLAVATGIDWDNVLEASDEKRKKRGSFEKGTILLETSWSSNELEEFDADKIIPLKYLAEIRSDNSGLEVSYTALMCNPMGVRVNFSDNEAFQFRLTQNGLKIEKINRDHKEPNDQLSLDFED